MPHPSLAQCEQFHEQFEKEHSELRKQPAIFRLGLRTSYFELNYFPLEKIPELLFKPHIDSGLDSAEIDGGIFEDPSAKHDFYRGIPIENFGKNPPDRIKKIIDLILEAAKEKKEQKKHKIYIDLFGTGAYLHSRTMKGDGNNPLGGRGYYDLDKYEQDERMAVFQNWINIAHLLGVKIIACHSIATTNPEEYDKIDTLENFARAFGWPYTGNLDPKTPMSRGEALNIRLFRRLQEYNPEVSCTTELMYQHNGVAPITIEQMIRMLTIIELNGPKVKANTLKKVYARMNPSHVIVRQPGVETKKEDDYNISLYAERVCWPRWETHFNNMDNNKHGFPTQEGRAEDILARDRNPTPEVPYPRLHMDVYHFWVQINMWNCRVHQLTPEPKDVGNIEALGEKGAEVRDILAKELADTHTTDTRFKGYYIPKAMYNAFVERFREN